MRIGIDIRYACDHFPGIGRYVYSLVDALTNLPCEHQFVLFSNPALPNRRFDLKALAARHHVKLVETAAQPFRPNEQYLLPTLARRERLDLLHTPYLIKAYFGMPCPTVLTLYDAIVWHYPKLVPASTRLIFPLALRLAVWRSQAIITISENARDDLAQAYRIDPKRIHVTPLAAADRFQAQSVEHQAELRARYQLPEQFVLYVGSNKPHKNLEGLIRAWDLVCHQLSDPPLLLIAGHYDERYPAARQLVQAFKLDQGVRFLPDIAESDLPALYSAATLFVYPSLYEGFGLTPLEALACGSAVICSNRSSLPEVVGEAARLVDPLDPQALATAILDLLNDPHQREELRQRGLEQATCFSWQQTAKLSLALYEQTAHYSS